jgi:hypothetical protein
MLLVFSGFSLGKLLVFLGLLLWLFARATAPQMLSTSVGIGTTIFFAVVSIVTFMWPLLGVHDRLVKEKQRLLRERSQLLEAMIVELHSRVKAGELHSRDELHVFISSLENEQSMLTRIPTWPWRPGTLRGFARASALLNYLG